MRYCDPTLRNNSDNVLQTRMVGKIFEIAALIVPGQQKIGSCSIADNKKRKAGNDK